MVKLDINLTNYVGRTGAGKVLNQFYPSLVLDTLNIIKMSYKLVNILSTKSSLCTEDPCSLSGDPQKLSTDFTHFHTISRNAKKNLPSKSD